MANPIVINQYNLSDFKYSDKAIWLPAKWSTPELRLPSRYKNIFIPTNQVAFKHVDNLLFIPAWLVKAIQDKNRLSQYKYEFPKPRLVLNVPDKSMWEDFKEMYPFVDIVSRRI